MTFSKRKERLEAEGPTSTRRLVEAVASASKALARGIKRELRAALKRRPKAKRPRPSRRSALPSYTKRGMGRRHVYGTVRRTIPELKPDSLDPRWKLTPHARRERERANKRRGK